MEGLFQSRRSRLERLRQQREQAIRGTDKKADPRPCPTCGQEMDPAALAENYYICPHCGGHLPIGGYLRLSMLLDPLSFRELWPELTAPDVLHFPGYGEKLTALREKTGLSDALIAATGKIGGIKAVFAVLDSRFLMGSMGAAVGEKVTRAVEYADKRKLPLIIFSASGGARMQEGIISLMQMAKTSAALRRFSDNGGLYISVFTHPTTGGVTASFASLGDITLAEPGALIGFAGPRVIQQTIHQELPEGFQRSEFLEAHGFVDQIVPRNEMRETLLTILSLHGKENRRWTR